MKLSSVRRTISAQTAFLARPHAGARQLAGLLVIVCAMLCTLISGGCSSAGYYPVQGKVLDQTGQPIAGLEGSQIVFTLVDGATSSVGEIGNDGSFTIFTDKPGDGAPPGEYQVHIARRYLDPEHPAPQVIDSKYEKPETSGLEATVEPKRNNFEFKVARNTKRSA